MQRCSTILHQQEVMLGPYITVNSSKNSPRPVATRREDLSGPVLVGVLPEWLCGIASSAPLQTWSLHGDSSREKEAASVGEGGGPRCCWLLKVIYSPAYAGLHRRDLL